jgi:hypothetical protein
MGSITVLSFSSKYVIRTELRSHNVQIYIKKTAMEAPLRVFTIQPQNPISKNANYKFQGALLNKHISHRPLLADERIGRIGTIYTQRAVTVPERSKA